MYDQVKIRVLCGDACGVVVEFVELFVVPVFERWLGTKWGLNTHSPLLHYPAISYLAGTDVRATRPPKPFHAKK